MSLSLIETALKCAQRGWYIFPLQAKGKRPNLALCPNWSKDSSNDPEKIRQWWTAAPDANIGIDLGRSNLTVLDFDRGNPPSNLGLPETFTVRTGKGYHVYFAGTAPQSDMHFGGAHIGEVKSAGGYAVGPKSTHESGATYSPVNQNPVAALPLDIVQKLTNKLREPVDASLNGAKIPFGQHDTTLNRIAGKPRNKRLHIFHRSTLRPNLGQRHKAPQKQERRLGIGTRS
jgi:hypothetical protein